MFDFINPEPTLFETVSSSPFFFGLFAAAFIVLATVALRAKVKRLLTYFQASFVNYVNNYNANALSGLSPEILVMFQKEAFEVRNKKLKVQEDILKAKFQELPAPATMKQKLLRIVISYCLKKITTGKKVKANLRPVTKSENNRNTESWKRK